MPSPITPHEAGALLAEIEATRARMRHTIRAHRGHFHLWIWGGVWIAMPLAAYFGGDGRARLFPWICLAGGVLSTGVGFLQGRQIRQPTNLRLVAAIAALWLFGALFPVVLRAPLEVRSLYAFFCLVAMQSYIIAGLWTDTYLLWVGVIVTALILGGVFLFPGVFWLWMAVFGGGTLVLTGFYVRHFWR